MYNFSYCILLLCENYYFVSMSVCACVRVHACMHVTNVCMHVLVHVGGSVQVSVDLTCHPKLCSLCHQSIVSCVFVFLPSPHHPTRLLGVLVESLWMHSHPSRSFEK